MASDNQPSEPQRQPQPSLVSRTEIGDVRAQELFAVAHTPFPPDEVIVSINVRDPQYVFENDQLLIRFTHDVTFFAADQADQAGLSEKAEVGDRVTVGEIRVAHIVQLSYNGDTPNDDEIDGLIISNTLFMVYPYVRSAIQRLAMDVGLPPLILPYLRRGAINLDMPHQAAAKVDGHEQIETR